MIKKSLYPTRIPLVDISRVRRILRMVPEEFTSKDLKKALEERKVLGEVTLRTARNKINHLKKLKAIEEAEELSRRDRCKIYRKTDLYKI